MALTSPDNLRSPNNTDQYALVQDLGAGQDSVQAALIKRANMYVGTAAQRTAFTTAANGVHWQDTDGDMQEWVRKGTAWEPNKPKVVSGMDTVATGALTAIGSTGNYGAAVNVDLPVVIEGDEEIIVSPLTLGNGWGMVALVATVRNPTNTRITLRFTQLGAAAQQNIRFYWQVVKPGV